MADIQYSIPQPNVSFNAPQGTPGLTTYSVPKTTMPTSPGQVVQPGAPPTAPVNPEDIPAKPHWTGGYALTIAIIALVLVIFVIILFLVRPQATSTVWNNANWTVYNRTTTNTTDTYTAYANSIYMNNGSIALNPLVIQNPGVSAGSLFIVDNTAGSADITCCFAGTGQTCTAGGLGATVVQAGTARQFVWTGTNTVHPYWISPAHA